MSDAVGFGIIGCGVIAPWHVAGIKGSSNARLVAVCDIIPEKAEKLAAENGNPRVCTDHRKLLEDPEVQAVCVCTPSGLHAKVGIDAAQAGKHVLSEKPIDITLENIDAFIAETKKAGVNLGCIFQRRTQPLWIAVHDAVQGGKLGKMVLADAYIKYYRSQEYYDSAGWRGTWEMDGGGALMNQGVHCVDLMRWIAGPPSTIYARCDHLVRKIEVEDTAVAAITYASGAFGVLEGTTSVWNAPGHRLEFHGEKGNILLEGERIVKWETEDGEGAPELVDPQAGSASANPVDIGKEGHRRQISDFAASIMEGRQPMIPGEEARGAVEFILAIYESSRRGQPVKLPL